MTRLALADVTAAPWKYTASQYASAAGVHQPWIGEISGTQRARMSQRSKTAYDQRRQREWQAASDVKAAWRQRVIDAYHAGRFDLRGPDVTEEARRTVERFLLDQEVARKAGAFLRASAENRIDSVDELQVGDRVYCLLASRYGVVQRTHKVSARLRFDDGREWTANVRGLQWLHYNELKAATEAGRTITPR